MEISTKQSVKLIESVSKQIMGITKISTDGNRYPVLLSYENQISEAVARGMVLGYEQAGIKIKLD